ncbi:hypothetical protein ALP92_05128 [Pseudomonas syringae pv. primulae]|uniref:Uncharacterized protein n=1 Tax=Pseudomonas syringae pv. primulae TaxID=251707 RepID=A0A3M4S5N0_9PSED|nr:hypothetical protein ALP92_05128 [Pseudomonas syringae pv. primulae]
MVVVHRQPSAHKQGPQGRAAAADHRADGRVVQAEVARLVQAVDRQVRRHAHLQAAHRVQAQYPGPARSAPAHHVLHCRCVGAAFFVTAGITGAGPFTGLGPLHQPGGVGFADHVAGLVGGRAVDADRHLHPSRFHGHHIGDAAAQAAIALRAVGDAGAAGPQQLDLLGVELHQVGEPHIRPQPFLLGTKRHRRHTVALLHLVLILHGFAEVAVQTNAQTPGGPGGFPQVLRGHGVGRAGGRNHHPAPGISGGIVVAPHQTLDVVQVLLQGFRPRCRPAFGLTHLRRPAPAQHKTQPQAFGFLEQHLGAVELHARQVQVMVVGDGGAAGARQFHQADARCQAKALLVEQATVAIGDRPQPRPQALVDAGGNALEQRLEQVMVGVDPCRIDHAIPGIQHTLPGQGWQGTEGGNAAVDDADVRPGMARRRAGQAGENRAGVAYQPAVLKVHMRLHTPHLRRTQKVSRIRFRANCAGSGGRAAPSG